MRIYSRNSIQVLFLTIVLLIPTISWAGSLLLFRGSYLIHEAFYGSIDIFNESVCSATQIQELTWGVDFDSTDHIAYDWSHNSVFVYNNLPYFGLPSLDDRLPMNVGGSSTIREVLVNQPLAVLDTDLRMLVVSEQYYDWTMPTGLLATGDINNDGVVGLFDAIIALQLMSGIEIDTPVYKQSACQGNAKIGVTDAIHALKVIAFQ